MYAQVSTGLYTQAWFPVQAMWKKNKYGGVGCVQDTLQGHGKDCAGAEMLGVNEDITESVWRGDLHWAGKARGMTCGNVRTMEHAEQGCVFRSGSTDTAASAEVRCSYPSSLHTHASPCAKGRREVPTESHTARAIYYVYKSTVERSLYPSSFDLVGWDN